MSKTEETVYALAEPIAAGCGVELYDVEFKKEGPDRYLRVFLYSKKGITIEECEAVSRKLSDELDRVDPIDGAYFLEVSSPGINRVLRRDRHFETALGERIDIRLFNPVNGRRNIRGTLTGYKDGTVFVTDDETGEPLQIEKKQAAQIKIFWE